VLFFTLQVENRMHLARVMRRLRSIPEVVRIFRIKGRRDGRAASQ
jgi:GTP pyrophosphokinase